MSRYLATGRILLAIGGLTWFLWMRLVPSQNVIMSLQIDGSQMRSQFGKIFFRKYTPSRVLEVGSYEGASACFLVDEIASDRPLELHCIDTWANGIEHQKDGPVVIDMDAVKGRFDRNMERSQKSTPFIAWTYTSTRVILTLFWRSFWPEARLVTLISSMLTVHMPRRMSLRMRYYRLSF